MKKYVLSNYALKTESGKTLEDPTSLTEVGGESADFDFFYPILDDNDFYCTFEYKCDVFLL